MSPSLPGRVAGTCRRVLAVRGQGTPDDAHATGEYKYLHIGKGSVVECLGTFGEKVSRRVTIRSHRVHFPAGRAGSQIDPVPVARPRLSCPPYAAGTE